MLISLVLQKDTQGTDDLKDFSRMWDMEDIRNSMKWYLESSKLKSGLINIDMLTCFRSSILCVEK